MLGNFFRIGLALSVVAAVIAAPLVYSAFQQKQLRHFRVLVPGKIYRSGQPTPTTLKKTIDDYGIKTVITLREPPKVGNDWEANLVQGMGLQFIRLVPASWEAPAGQTVAPVQPNIDRFLAILDEQRSTPLWLHCFAGTHRTGAYSAIYRMEYERWTNEEAISELKQLGYDNLENEPDVLGYLTRYTPRWKRTSAMIP
jgi:tyrosine-protein phosphatase SIW14